MALRCPTSNAEHTNLPLSQAAPILGRSCFTTNTATPQPDASFNKTKQNEYVVQCSSQLSGKMHLNDFFLPSPHFPASFDILHAVTAPAGHQLHQQPADITLSLMTFPSPQCSKPTGAGGEAAVSPTQHCSPQHCSTPAMVGES